MPRHTRNIQVAQLWQSDRAKLDTFLIIIHKIAFFSLYDGIRGNTSALYESFNARKLCSRVSSRECHFYSKNKLALLSHPLWGWGFRGNVYDSTLASWKVLSGLLICYN